MNEQPYLIPSASALFEEEIKKSVFITHLAHTPSIETAKQFVEQVKKEHSSARHNCWGFAAGRPEDSMKWGFSDDGEPSGTAGKPILAQLSGSGVGELTAVVTRYSGGIKLGTGGLVKAYGGGVQQALKLLQTIEKKITTKLTLVSANLSPSRRPSESVRTKTTSTMAINMTRNASGTAMIRPMMVMAKS